VRLPPAIAPEPEVDVSEAALGAEVIHGGVDGAHHRGHARAVAVTRELGGKDIEANGRMRKETSELLVPPLKACPTPHPYPCLQSFDCLLSHLNALPTAARAVPLGLIDGDSDTHTVEATLKHAGTTLAGAALSVKGGLEMKPREEVVVTMENKMVGYFGGQGKGNFLGTGFHTYISVVSGREGGTGQSKGDGLHHVCKRWCVGGICWGEK